MSTLRALFRSAVALLLKEVQQHVGSVVLLGLLTLPAMFCGLVVTMGEGGASIATVGVGVVYYWMPIVAMVLVRRLVVLEREDGTHGFLAALPPPAWLRTSVKLLVATSAMWALGLPALLAILLFASLRELITLAWVLQLVVQAGLYLGGWTAVCFVITHLGRYRNWVWIGLLGVLEVVGERQDWQSWTWLAALAGPTEVSRHLVPWSGMLVTALYALAGVGVVYFLTGWRGGALPDSWFGRSSTRDRIAGTSVLLLWVFTTDVIPEVGTPSLRGWDTLPEAVAGDGRVRTVDPSLRPHAEALLRALDRVDGWTVPPQVVLLPEAGGPDLPEVPVRRWDSDGDTLVLRVRGPADAGFVARAVGELLEQRSSGLLAYAVDRAWLRDGLGLYLAEGEDAAVSERRAAWAIAAGLREEQLQDWASVRRTYGEDVAAGIAAVGLRVWAASVGEPQRSEVLQDSLIAPRGAGPFSPWTLGLSAPAQADDDALRSRWWEALQEAAARRSGELDVPVMPSLTLTRAESTRSSFDVAYTLDGELPPDAVIVLRELDPVRGVALARTEVWRTPVSEAVGEVSTWLSAWGRAEGSLSVWSVALQGRVSSGWVEVSP